MAVEDRITEHYASSDLLERIRAGLAAMGLDPDHPRPEDLKPVDEFHMGGTRATRDLLARLDLGPGTRVLDIGSGLGGPARLFAAETGCHVTGIDLTEDFVTTANALSAMTGFSELTRFAQGSALDLPFAAGRFDVATMIHVGANLPDKPRLFAEVARVLRPGGTFAIYDAMRTGPGPIPYPVPWSEVADTDFADTPEAYIAAAGAAGFACIHQNDRRALALEFFGTIPPASEPVPPPPPLGIHLVTGPGGRNRVRNLVAAIEAGRVAPVELIFRLPH